ncbi:MAG: phosphoglycerate mutase family protein [bacterium]
MPTQIVLVRHAICTGNAAEKASRSGDHTLFTKDIRRKKSRDWPLTPLGVTQSLDAGIEIRRRISESFDYYTTSGYLRAEETASHLGFLDAIWKTDVLLAERNWGGVENLPLSERKTVMERLGISACEDSMIWRPPRGESMVSVIGRVKLFLLWAKENLSGKSLLIVSHGGPIQAMRVIQHGIEPKDYQKFISGDNYIRNCHVFHYSVKNNDDVIIPKFCLERSLFAKANGEWIENVQNINNH